MSGLTIDIKSKGKPVSAYIYAPFYRGVEILKRQGYRLISLEKNARLRIQKGKYADISQDGNFVREGILYVPDKGVFLVKKSPILKYVEEGLTCNIDEKDFYAYAPEIQEEFEMALKDSVRIDATQIPTNRFKDNDITTFAFDKIAEDYGKFLQEAGIKEMPICFNNSNYDNKQKTQFARQMWFGNLLHKSGLSGFESLTHYYNIRGVFDARCAKNLKAVKKPTLEQIVSLSKRFIPEATQSKFKQELRKLYSK